METKKLNLKKRERELMPIMLKTIINLAEFHMKNLAELFKQEVGKR